MSRMGAKPIAILENTTVTFNDGNLICKGKQGEMTLKIHPKIKVNITDKEIVLERLGNDKLAKSLHGVTRKLIINAISGVNELFEKKLEVNGVGYRVALTGKNLQLNVGYSHPVIIEAPTGITFKVNKNIISVFGIDKAQVGLIAAKIRSVRKPEPYKGKGIKYQDEIIRRKAGKAAKAGEK